jgi:hypothetical protein
MEIEKQLRDRGAVFLRVGKSMVSGRLRPLLLFKKGSPQKIPFYLRPSAVQMQLPLILPTAAAAGPP